MTTEKTPFDCSDLEELKKIFKFDQREQENFNFVKGQIQERQRLRTEVEEVLEDVCKECQYGCLRLLKMKLGMETTK